MGDKTKIEWSDASWNCVIGCSKVSPGCTNCYAIGVVHRAMSPQHVGLTIKRPGEPTDWTGEIRTVPHLLDQPLRWKKPRRIFVNSLSDLFHPDLPDDEIAKVFAVMALTPHHTYQVLTKRPQRMADVLGDPAFPGMVARAADAITVRREIEAMGAERMKEIDGFPGYIVTDRGRVLLEGGSDTCLWCGDVVPGRSARARFCSQACNSKAHYEAKQGRWSAPVSFRELSYDIGDQGYRRATMVSSDGVKQKRLVHRLVLAAFRREPAQGEQGCHRDGDPSNNALPNLRWGTQEDNWADRTRHGNSQSHSRLTLQEVGEIRSLHEAGTTASWLAERFGISDTQVRNIARGDQWAERTDWPLPGVWLGTSIESDRYAFRADHLRRTPAAVRWISAEPLLGPLPSLDLTGIDWLVVGAESGPGAREMDEDWVRDLRDRCQPSYEVTGHDHAGMTTRPTHEPAFFYKQRLENGKKVGAPELDGRQWLEYPTTRSEP